jgi:hypothetical protein
LPKGGDPTPLLELLTTGNLKKVAGGLLVQVKAGSTKPQLVERLVRECKKGLKIPEVFAPPVSTFALKIGPLLFVLFSCTLSCLILLSVLTFFITVPHDRPDAAVQDAPSGEEAGALDEDRPAGFGMCE